MNKSMTFYKGTAETKFVEEHNLNFEAREKYREYQNYLSQWCNQAKSTADIVLPTITSNQLTDLQTNIIQNMIGTVLIPGIKEVNQSLIDLDEVLNTLNKMALLFDRFFTNLIYDFSINGFWGKEKIRLPERHDEIRKLNNWFELKKTQINSAGAMISNIKIELKKEQLNLFSLRAITEIDIVSTTIFITLLTLVVYISIIS